MEGRMLHDRNTLNKEKPDQQPEEGESCHRHIEQERCLHSLADAVHVNVRDVASDGKLLAGQDGGQQPQQSLYEVPGDRVEVQKKRSQLVQKFRDGEQVGAQTIENSPALYLCFAAKIATSNTFPRASIAPALQPSRQRSRGTGLFSLTRALSPAGY